MKSQKLKYKKVSTLPMEIESQGTFTLMAFYIDLKLSSDGDMLEESTFFRSFHSISL